MLIVKVYTNLDLIDEIWIHNTGEVKKGIFAYDIEKPDWIPKKDRQLVHERADGYESLLLQAIGRICHAKENRKPEKERKSAKNGDLRSNPKMGSQAAERQSSRAKVRSR